MSGAHTAPNDPENIYVQSSDRASTTYPITGRRPCLVVLADGIVCSCRLFDKLSHSYHRRRSTEEFVRSGALETVSSLPWLRYSFHGCSHKTLHRSTVDWSLRPSISTSAVRISANIICVVNQNCWRLVRWRITCRGLTTTRHV